MTIELSIDKYQKPVKANPFDAVVAQLADQNKTNPAPEGTDNIGRFIVPADMKPGYAKVQLQKAARAAGFSARTPEDEATKEGHKIGFTLHPRKVRSPKEPATIVEAEAADNVEVS